MPPTTSQELDVGFRTAFDHAPFGMVIADAEGRFLRVNQAFARLVGRGIEELIGRDSRAFTHPDDLAVTRQFVAGAPSSDSAPLTVEKRYVRPDGTIVWARTSLSSGIGEDGRTKYLIGVAEDITAQKRTSEELVETRRKLRSALIAGEVATYEWDVRSDRLWGDANFDQIFGTERDEDGTAPLARFVDAIHPDDRDRVMTAVNHTVDTGAEYDIEYRVINGTMERWVSARGRLERDDERGIVRFHGVVLDITARKRAEQELQGRSQLYDTFLSNTQDLAYLIDREGRFIYANRSLLALWGMTLEEVNGKNLYDLGYPKWHADMNMREFAEVIEKKKTIRGSVPYTSPTGVHGTYEYVFSPVLGDDGEVELIAGTSRDVTERMKIAETQKLAQEALHQALESERAARSEAERTSRIKDEFLATLSHELRTPLAAVLGWAQILGGGGTSAAEVEEGIAVIARNARVQAQIIDDLLEMSRIVSGKIRLDVQPLRLVDVIRASVATVQAAADAKRVVIHLSPDDENLRIRGDVNRLQQVFWNLLSNAVKFTPAGGRVDVRLVAGAAHVEVCVRDTGEGIRPEFLPFVFDRFRQADATTTRRHGGLGLGLAIVRQLTELHGGTVRVESMGSGQGSTFFVRLPLAAVRQEAEPETPRQAPKRVRPPGSMCADVEGMRVLVVDDEGDARGVVRRFLEDCGVAVTEVSSVSEALETLAVASFDVLVSDIGMPEEDGYSLIRKVRAAGNGIPAIALTAYARPEDRVRVIEAGYQTHLAKPADAGELVALVAGFAFHK